MRLASAPSSRSVPYLSKEEVERFFASIPKERIRDLLVFDLIYRYGLRRRELALIRRDHVSPGGIWITRMKGGISGEYPVHPTTRRRLWAYLTERGTDGPYLIRTRQSGDSPISPSSIYLWFRAYAAAAGLPAERRNVHVLRHSIAVHLMNVGWDVADVQDWLGHRDIASTMWYAAVTNKRRAANYERARLSPEIADI